MKGKTVGDHRQSPVTGPSTRCCCGTTHMTSKQIPSVNVGDNLVPSILSGRVDAIVGGYRNVEAIQIAQEMGVKPTVFPASELGVPSYAELVLVANRNRLKTDAAYATEVKKFVGAARRRPHRRPSLTPPARRRSWSTPPSTRPSSSRSASPTRSRLIKPDPGQKVGCMSETAWQSFGNWMKSQKLITASPTPSQLTTDAYLPYSC